MRTQRSQSTKCSQERLPYIQKYLCDQKWLHIHTNRGGDAPVCVGLVLLVRKMIYCDHYAGTTEQNTELYSQLASTVVTIHYLPATLATI